MNFHERGEFSPIATEEDIVACFRLLLGRYPQMMEWPGHSRLAGEPLAEVVRSYLAASEFCARGLLAPSETSEKRWVSFGDFWLYIDPTDIAVGGPIAISGAHEPNVTAEFRKRVKPGMNVLDIGGNIGYFSMLSAALVGPTGRVWAVEPNPANVAMLSASAKRNEFEARITVIESAASDKWAPLLLYTSGSTGSVRPVSSLDEVARKSVMGIPLDAVIGDERVDVVKIDIEGAEGIALRGLLKTLRRCRPIIFSEFCAEAMPGLAGMRPEEYLAMLIDLGYRLLVLEDSGPVACGISISAVMDLYRKNRTDHVDILCERAD